MSGLWKGALLGAINVVVIAIAMAAFEASPEEAAHRLDAGTALLVIMFGGLPGIVGGLMLGALAYALERSAIALRIAVLTLPALGLVFLLAREFQMMHLALVSCIPTAVAALILERWTRKPADPPPVPVARAVS